MSALAPSRLAELDSFILELNTVAAGVILPLFRGDHGILNKLGPGGFDPVTEADKGAERAIRALIAPATPITGCWERNTAPTRRRRVRLGARSRGRDRPSSPVCIYGAC